MSPRSPHATAHSLLGEAQRSARPTPHRKDDAPTKAIFADGLLIEAAPIYLLRNMPCAARVIKIGVCGPTGRNDLFKLISISICRLARSAQHLYGTPQIPTLGVRLGRAGLEARGKFLGI